MKIFGEKSKRENGCMYVARKLQSMAVAKSAELRKNDV